MLQALLLLWWWRGLNCSWLGCLVIGVDTGDEGIRRGMGGAGERF